MSVLFSLPITRALDNTGTALPGAPAERKSAPAQKLLPLPVTTTARNSRSSRARAIASRKPPSTSGVMLLRFSGRLSVIVATSSWIS